MHSMETYHTGRWRSNSSTVEPNFTARWRRGMPSSRSRRDLNQYYREATPGVGSSSTRTPPWRNISSARNPRSQRLRWRDHRWSAGNNLQ
ncbi:hypothetical protein L6164_012449 [Bauhinia variegata]|nr:hypothetical protein L6164_012449 [Bauhinia variegata]